MQAEASVTSHRRGRSALLSKAARRLGLAALSLAAAAGAQELEEIRITAPEPRYAAPTLRDRIGRIWAPVYLNGRGPFRLVLDTGASHSAVTPQLAATLGDAVQSGEPVRLRGVTGTDVVPTIRVDSLALGDLLLAPATLPVVADVFGGADGVLGTGGLEDKRISVDFRGDSITVSRSRLEPPGHGFVTLPFTLMQDNLLVFDVVIGGVPAKAVLDTGAPDSLGNTALLRALRRRQSDEPATAIVGVTLDVEHGDKIRIPAIEIEQIRIANVAMTFSDVYIFRHWDLVEEPAVLLGMDVAGSVDQLIIDYGARELYLRPRE